MATIGKLNEIQKELDIEWTISNFDALSEEADKYYASPSFSFNGSSWFLKIYPNGRNVDKSVGYLGLCLIRLSQGPPNGVDFSVGIKTSEGKRDRERLYTCICDSFGSRYVPKSFISQYGTPCGISRSQLFERKSELMPFNVLTMLCTLKNPRDIQESNYIATAECIHCQKLVDALGISSHEKICQNKPVKCPECAKIVMLQNWYDHQCSTAKTEGKTTVTECSYCRKVFDAASVSLHEKKCLERSINCSKCCEVVLLRDWCDHGCPRSKPEGEITTSESTNYRVESNSTFLLPQERKCHDKLMQSAKCDDVAQSSSELE